jgi:hypothetical protein
MERTRERRRDAVALAGAIALHAALLAYVTWTPTKRMFHSTDRSVEIALVEAKPKSAPPPVPTEPNAPEPERTKPRDETKTKPEHAVEPEVHSTAPTAPVATEPVPTTTPTTIPEGQSLVRLPAKRDGGAIGRVLGTGGELGPTAMTLENSLDIKADGPMSDAKRAALTAKRHLESDIADDEVSAGLADDYFRELKNRLETNWRPAMKDLNDGGETVTRYGFMKGLVDDDGRAGWDEMWKAYLDLAKQYAQNVPPHLDPPRIERLRELMRSRKRPFQYHAITEAVLTQGPDGRVVTIEIPLSSGHPGIDEEVKEAIETAVKAMVDPPPARVAHGRPFSSTWRMRATWIMVPPTAFLTGAGFDITPKGFTMDVPFDIQLKTNVMLLSTDAHAHADAASPEP